MRNSLPILAFVLFSTIFIACSQEVNTFQLTNRESMLMIGKGAGQDATINPYAGQKSVAVIKNKGDANMSVRIQRKGDLLLTQEIEPKEKKEIILDVDHELYFDAEGNTTVEIYYQKYKHTQ